MASAPSATSSHMPTGGLTLKLDERGESAFVKFFRSMPAKSAENVVRFFDRRDYYTVHGDDAKLIAAEFFKTEAVMKTMRGGLPYVCCSAVNFETFARELILERRCRVEVWAQRSSAAHMWALSRHASPGNLQDFEDVLFSHADMIDNPVVVAVRFKATAGEKRMSVAFADAAARRLGVCEFLDNDAFANLEALLLQVGAKEAIWQRDSSADGRKIADVFARCELAVTEERAATFRDQDLEQDLKRLLGDEFVSSLPALDAKSCLPCLAGLISFLNLLGNDSNAGRFSLEVYDARRFMRLDASASKALNLFPAREDSSRSMSLFGLLNQCKTGMGSRLLSSWLKQPLLDGDEIARRHDVVEAFLDDPDLLETIHDDKMRRVPDLHRLVAKLQSVGRGSLQDLVRVYQFVACLPAWRNAFAAHSGRHRSLLADKFLEPLTALQQDFGNFEQLVEQSIDLDAITQHEYLINADFDEGLQEIKAQKEALLAELEAVAERAADSLGLELGKSLKFERNDKNGHYLRVSRKDEKCLRNNARFTTIETRKDGVRFTNAKLRRMDEEFSALVEEYAARQHDLRAKVLEIAATYAPVMQRAASIIADMDVLASFAHVAATAPGGRAYVRPEIVRDEDGIVSLHECRHPCLEAQDDVSFIPNTVELLPKKSQVQIVTGPNMGGKSTYIRQAGVVVLMAHVGAFVPCTSARVSLCDCILARVGASDSQLRGVSTFMAEMLETATILKTATPRSLVIIDELGRGTSTYDGFGLAWAISEHIAREIRAPCLFATHFHELTALADVCEGVVNRHVTAHTTEDDITFLYRVNDGPCEKSFGIHVARLARFPDAVLRVAKRKADELEDSNRPLERDVRDRLVNAARELDASVVDAGRRAMRQLLSQPDAETALDDETPPEARNAARKRLRASMDDVKNEYVARVLGIALEGLASNTSA